MADRNSSPRRQQHFSSAVVYLHHRLSSAYHPQSNGRAEVAVKSMKRLLTAHTDRQGGIDTEAVAAGLLQYRNTPDRETGMSSAQIVFGQNLRDLLPIAPGSTVFNSGARSPCGRRPGTTRRRLSSHGSLQTNGRPQPRNPPVTSASNRCQRDHSEPVGTTWQAVGQNGIIELRSYVEVRSYDQYLVKVHGPGRVTLRNRRFLRRIVSIDRRSERTIRLHLRCCHP